MALVNVPADAWLDLGTITVKSAVQCRGPTDLLVGVSAGGAPATEQDGILLAPREAIPIESGARVWVRPATPGQDSSVNLVDIAV